jgi:uncharacterized protein YegL
MSKLIYTGKNLPSKNIADFNKLLQIANQPVSKLKSYTARITRTTPTAFVFLLDQSGSMSEEIEIGGENKSKSEFLADAINEMLNAIVDKCKRQTEYRDYIHLCVIGYGGDEDSTAKIAWEGNLEGQTFVNVSQLISNSLDKQEKVVKTTRPDGSFREIKKFVYRWISPRAESLTPMHDALLLAHDLLVEWVSNYKGLDIYPPTVFNITDGAATGTTNKDLLDISERLKNITTADGNALLYNVHIADDDAESILFPCKKEELPDDEYSHLLFDMSSDLPAIYNNDIAMLTKRDIKGAYSGMAVNVSMSKLISLLNIGTNTPLRNTV